MTPAACGLEVHLDEPTLGTLVMDGTSYVAQKLTLGPVVVRAVTDDRTGADGADDRTINLGARAVSLVALPLEDNPDGATLQQLAERLMAYCHPARRVILSWIARQGDEWRRVRLRVDTAAEGLVVPLQVYDVVQVGWVWPDAVKEAIDEVIAQVPAAGDTAPGISFPVTFPIAWPAADAQGVQTLTNDGTVESWPILRLYGPATNPRIENRTTGQKMELTAGGGLVLGSGEYVELDTLERTVELAGDPAESRYNRVDFAVSNWWGLVPGDNELRYYPTSFDPGAVAEVRYRPAYL